MLANEQRHYLRGQFTACAAAILAATCSAIACQPHRGAESRVVGARCDRVRPVNRTAVGLYGTARGL